MAVDQKNSGAVTYVPGSDISELLAPRPRVQPLAGFDEDYADFVDYIIKCTHRIWEEKNLGLIYTHYTHNCLVHTLGGQTYGAEEVVQNTMRTLAAFPDRTLYGDHVIWGGDEVAGFYSSHRITSFMTNLGPSEFGPATGKRVRTTTIADCAVKANRIYEEWLVRDNSWIARQLGLDPVELARAQAAAMPKAAHEEWRMGEIDRVLGQVAPEAAEIPRDASEDPEAFARAVFQEIWNRRMFGAVRRVYSPSTRLEAPNGRRLFGHGEIIGWIVALLSTVPDARVTVDHVCAVPNGQPGGVDIAVRWSLAGTHKGPALYGAPSNRRLLILGVTHWTVTAGRITGEWTIFDELAVLRHTFGAPGA